MSAAFARPPARRAIIEVLANQTHVLGSCATGTRLQLQFPRPADAALGPVALVDDPLGARGIEAIAASYAAVAAAFGLPIILDAPTWWATPHRLAASGYQPADAAHALARCVAILAPIRQRYTDVYLSGMLGPLADGYRAGHVGSVAAATEHHRWQADGLAATGVDMILAATFANASDLHGAARASAATGLPYVLGPVIDPLGRMPDGTRVAELIERVDNTVAPAPAHWAVCCTDPATTRRALDAIAASSSDAIDRIRQLKANGSAATVDEREARNRVLSDEPEPWASTAVDLAHRHGLTVLGGCCGTDDRHLLSLAARLAVSES